MSGLMSDMCECTSGRMRHGVVRIWGNAVSSIVVAAEFRRVVLHREAASNLAGGFWCTVKSGPMKTSPQQSYHRYGNDVSDQ
jgi:hypothetical protein